jgi:hypothetical protein
MEKINPRKIPVGDKVPSILKEVDDMLNLMNIKYWLAFGSGLMVYRDGKIADHDWDLDLHILAEDISKIDRKVIKEHGFTSFKWKQDIPSFITKDGIKSTELYLRTISFEKDGVRIDIDPLYETVDGIGLACLKGRKREQFIGYFNKDWFYDPIIVEFNNKKYLVPREEYFVSNYGETWKIPEVSHTNWNTRSCRKNFYQLL